jgi:hypothetical protein
LEWRVYAKSVDNMIEIIKRDESYLDDLVIDCISESAQLKMISMKELMDKAQNSEDFREVLKGLLSDLLKERIFGLKANDRQNLITICYIKSGIEIFRDFKKYQEDSLSLEKYFRAIETEDTETLFLRVTESLLGDRIDFCVNLGEVGNGEL